MNYCFSNLHVLYKSKELTNLNVLIGGEEIKLHRVVFIANSPVFYSMLKTVNQSPIDVIEINDCHVSVFLEFVDYMYLGVCDVKKFPIDLLAVARKYEVVTLLAKCENFLKRNLGISTAVECLRAAHLYDVPKLEADAMLFIRSHYRHIRPTMEWNNLVRKFQLMTKFILTFPPKIRVYNTGSGGDGRILHKFDVPRGGGHTGTGPRALAPFVEWQIGWDEAFKGVCQSPLFEGGVAEQLLKFRLKFLHNFTQPSCFQLVLMSESYNAPVEISAKFVLHSLLTGKSIETNSVVSWTSSADSRERTVLLVSSEALRKDTFSLSGNMVFKCYCDSNLNGIAAPVLFTPVASHVQDLRRQWFPQDLSVDVHFKLGDTLIPGNRDLLAEKSPFFRNLFRQERDIYELPDDPQNFRAIVTYLHTGQLFAPTESLLKASEKFSIPDLIDKLAANVSRQTAVQSLISGHKFNCEPIERQALKYIKYNVKSVVLSPGWAKLEDYPELVQRIIDELVFPAYSTENIKFVSTGRRSK